MIGKPDHIDMDSARTRKLTKLFLALRDFAPEERQHAIDFAMGQLAEQARERERDAARPDESEDGGSAEP